MIKTGYIDPMTLPRHLGGPRFAADDPPIAPVVVPPTPPSPPPAPQHVAPPPPPPPPRQTDDPAALRAEAAAYRIDARNNKEAADRAIAERDRIQREADERVAAATAQGQTVAQKFKNKAADAELRAAATAAGLQDLDILGLSIVDRSKLVIDDEGNVSGADVVIADLKAKKPNYFTPQSATPPTPTPRTGFAPPPVVPGSTPPAPPSVRAVPKADYNTAKAAALSALPK